MIIFTKNTIHINIIIENTNIVHDFHTIDTGAIHYLLQRLFLLIFWVSSHKGHIVEVHDELIDIGKEDNHALEQLNTCIYSQTLSLWESTQSQPIFLNA